MRSKGFSLMEVLVSIAIFAVVAGISYSTLDTYIDQRERLAVHYSKLEKLQRLFILLERDFQSIIDRPIQVGSNIKDSIEVSANSLIGMTVSEPDYNSPLGVAMKRVEWVLDDGELTRKVWDVLDTDGSYEPEEQVIGTDIEDMAIEFLFFEKNSDIKRDKKLQGRFPDGIELKVNLDSGEEYIRLFEVAKP